MRAIVTLLISLLMVACSDATSLGYEERPHSVVSIAHLKTLATGPSVTITESLSVEGYVVVNDLFGEYYKSVVISDESGGIELCVDCSRTAVEFPVSARVTVHCTGLAVGNYGGRVMLGAQPEREYTVDRIKESDLGRYITVDRNSASAVQPMPIKIKDIDTSEISNFVAISDLTFGNQAGLEWCDRDPLTGEYLTTNRTATDRTGHTISVRTQANCSYRNEKIPSDYGTLYGIVEYFNGSYSLRIVNHSIDFGR